MTDLKPQPPPAGLPAAAAPEPPQACLLAAARRRYDALAALLARGAEDGSGMIDGIQDADLVHDLRVGSRRLGEVTRLLKTFLDKPTAKAVAASLKALRRAMGDLRDSDVTCEHLLKWRIPAALRRIAVAIAAELQAARPGLEAAARAQMRSASLTGSMLILSRVLEDCAAPDSLAATEQQLSADLDRLVRSREKRLRRAFGKAASKQTAASLHAARIEVKKLRYLLELAADAGAVRGAKKKILFLKQLQQLLGDHHDTHVITEQLAAHLKIRRPHPLPGLAPAWRKWQRRSNTLQSKRAAAFFARSYAWINA